MLNHGQCFPSTALVSPSQHHVLLLWGSQHWELGQTGTTSPRSPAPGPSLWCSAPSAMSQLCVPFPGPISMSHLQILSLCPISMSHLQVPSPRPTLCPISTSHLHVPSPCPISTSHLPVPSPRPISMSHLHVPFPGRVPPTSCTAVTPAAALTTDHGGTAPEPCSAHQDHSAGLCYGRGRAWARPWGVGGETQGNSATRCHRGIAIVMCHGDGARSSQVMGVAVAVGVDR